MKRSERIMYTWNPVFNFVMNLKHRYEEQFGTAQYKTYTLNDQKMTCLEYWIHMLHDTAALQRIQYLVLNQNQEFLLVKYAGFNDLTSGESAVTLEEFWELYDGFYLECRSVVLDLKEECIALSPFKKFRNLNEGPENQMSVITEKIKHASTVEITNKLDGSMQCARWYHSAPFLAGSQAIDPANSWRLADGYRMLTTGDHYINMLRENPGCTFIFEYIALRDAHVVKYEKDQEGLYLIGIREVQTGRQYSYKEVAAYAAKYDVPMTQIFNKTFEQVLKEIKTIKSDEQEGFVLNIDGHMLKVKADDYVQIHRILSKLSSINLIIQSIAEDRMDDLLSKVPEVYKPRIYAVEKIARNYMAQTRAAIKKYYEEAPKDNKKIFMLWVEENVPRDYRHYVRNEYLGVPYDLLKSGPANAPRYKKLTDMGVTDYKEIFE